jgi:hypothetical protein
MFDIIETGSDQRLGYRTCIIWQTIWRTVVLLSQGQVVCLWSQTNYVSYAPMCMYVAHRLAGAPVARSS